MTPIESDCPQQAQPVKTPIAIQEQERMTYRTSIFKESRLHHPNYREILSFGY